MKKTFPAFAPAARLMALAALFALSGCASVSRPDSVSPESFAAPARAIAAEITGSSGDYGPAEEGLRSLLAAVAAKYGGRATVDSVVGFLRAETSRPILQPEED